MAEKQKYPAYPIVYAEIWKPLSPNVCPNDIIKPYYYISNYGRLYSTYSNRLLFLSTDEDGYLFACIHTENKRDTRRFNQTNIRINRAVLITFCDNLPLNYQELQVNHRDSNRKNNMLWNLEWVTPYENDFHARVYGFKNTRDINGENNISAKLSNEDVYNIVDLLKSQKYTFKEISDMYNISPNVIRNIAHNKSWVCLELNISEDDIRYSNAFTNDEFHSICKYFECNDINNKSIFPSKISVLEKCFNDLGLYTKYDFESKRRTLSRLLDRSDRNKTIYEKVISKYNYYYNR